MHMLQNYRFNHTIALYTNSTKSTCTPLMSMQNNKTDESKLGTEVSIGTAWKGCDYQYCIPDLNGNGNSLQ